MSQKGQSLPEYALILAVVLVVCIASIKALGLAITRPMTDLSNFMTGLNFQP